MEHRQQCDSKAMVLFFLAFCCAGNLSNTRCDDQDLEERFKCCWEKVIPVANNGEIKKKLKL